MTILEIARPAEAQITLAQFCRALAAHAMITALPHELRKVTAPETSETIASIIHRFALGERIGRPTTDDDDP